MHRPVHDRGGQHGIRANPSTYIEEDRVPAQNMPQVLIFRLHEFLEHDQRGHELVWISKTQLESVSRANGSRRRFHQLESCESPESGNGTHESKPGRTSPELP